MELKVATNSLHWSQPSVPQSPSSSQALVSAISSPSSSSKRRSFTLSCYSRSALFGTFHSSSYKLRSCHDLRRSHVRRTIIRALSASLASFPDEEFSKEIQESFEQPSFPERDDAIADDIERKANSLEIPMSLRIIKRKKQWQNGLIDAGESAYCSVKKAFSSMVFIIRELHSFSLQTREILFSDDLQVILSAVQKEMNASFVWLFQMIFSQTPTLMVYLMILLANYSVYSMLNSAVAVAAPPPAAQVSTVVEDQSHVKKLGFDSSIIKSFKLYSPSSSGKTTSIGANSGGGGGGGNYKAVTSGTDGDGKFDDESKSHYSAIINSETSASSSSSRNKNLASEQGEETKLWDSMIEESSKMPDEALNHGTMQRFVSPVDAKIEADDKLEYLRTELTYRIGLALEPESPLLLANYAQFLYIVAQDYDRAEEYFKRAAGAEPKDAEALNKYASFLWVVRKDLWAAEETYLKAIDVEPENSYYAANYAHFLWNTGGEDTCFPLD